MPETLEKFPERPSLDQRLIQQSEGTLNTKVLVTLLASLLPFLPLAAQSQLPPAATLRVDYDQDVKPLLAQNCYSCHGSEVQQSGLRLDLRQNALRGGDYGPVIIPGKSAESKRRAS